MYNNVIVYHLFRLLLTLPSQFECGFKSPGLLSPVQWRLAASREWLLLFFSNRMENDGFWTLSRDSSLAATPSGF